MNHTGCLWLDDVLSGPTRVSPVVLAGDSAASTIERRSRFLLCRRWRRTPWLMSLLLLLCAVYPASALSQGAEIIVRIDVEDRSDATVDLGAREALESVLLERSGDRDLLTHPAVVAALETARSSLSLYQFELIDGQMRFVAHIDPAIIESLIKEANGTLWAEPPPPLLLWLVIDDVDGRRFGNTPAEQPLWEALDAAFTELGVSLRQPLYDLPDAVLVSPETLWRQDYGPIVEASARYGASQIMMGRLIALSAGRYIGEWIYRDETVEQSISVQAASTLALVEPGLALAMGEVRRQYAVALSENNDQGTLRVSVRNVVSLQDYQAVTRLMAGIQTLDHVRPVAVEGDTLTLELRGISDPETLSRLMAARTDLVWLNADPDTDEGLLLAWQGN